MSTLERRFFWVDLAAQNSRVARWPQLAFAQFAQRCAIVSGGEALHEVRRTARRISERLPVPADR